MIYTHGQRDERARSLLAGQAKKWSKGDGARRGEGAELSSLRIEGFGRVPPLEFRYYSDGAILFRYVVRQQEEYPGFDSVWRVMSAAEQRETLRMGGRVAEWLRSLRGKESMKRKRREETVPVSLTPGQRQRLENLWFYYGNYGPKTTPGNHSFIQGLLERGQDERPLKQRGYMPTEECEQAAERVLLGNQEPEEDHSVAARLRRFKLISTPAVQDSLKLSPDEGQ